MAIYRAALPQVYGYLLPRCQRVLLGWWFGNPLSREPGDGRQREAPEEMGEACPTETQAAYDYGSDR